MQATSLATQQEILLGLGVRLARESSVGKKIESPSAKVRITTKQAVDGIR